MCTRDPLAETSDQDSTLLLVLIAKVLTVTNFLLPGPAPHLKTTNKSENYHTPVQLTDQVDTQPSENLEHIVGAGNPVKPKALGNATLSGTGATEITQNQVGIEVEDLAESENSKTGIHESLVGLRCSGGSVRTEDPVGDIETGQHPVVSAILEDVASRHGGAAEAVHEDSFILALQEVQGQKDADQELSVGGSGNSVVVEVE